MTEDARNEPLSLTRILGVTAAVLTLGAGVIHFMAVGDHREHALIAAFFVATALAQVGWAVAMFLRPSRLLLLAGVAGNLGIVALWAITRTTGLPFIPGAEAPEPVGMRDVAATLLEVMSVATAGIAVALPAAAAAVVLVHGRRFVAGATAVALVLVAPAALATGGHHGDQSAAASGHAHGATEQADGDHGGPGHEGHHGDQARQAGDHAAHSDSLGTHLAGTHAQNALSSGHGDHTGFPLADHSAHGGPGHEGHHADGAHSGHAGTGHGDHAGHSGTTGDEGFGMPAMWGTKSTMRVGPFALAPAQAGGDAHINRVGVLSEQPCQDCYITGMVPRLVYADGSDANIDTGPMLHHLVVSDTGREDPTCARWNGIGALGQRVFAAGNERTPFSLPRGFGFRASPSPFAYVAEIMNHSSSAKEVYVEADVFHVPASKPGMKQVIPVWLDVANCGFSEYSVPAGRSTEKWSWTSTLTGRVVAAGGHVHAGGVGIVMSNKTTRQRMCTSEAAYGTRGAFRGEVTAMSTCYWDRIGTVRKGEQLQLATIYDTPKPLDGVMGIMMIAVYETNDLKGGTTAPSWMRRNPDTAPPDSGHDH